MFKITLTAVLMGVCLGLAGPSASAQSSPPCTPGEFTLVKKLLPLACTCVDDVTLSVSVGGTYTLSNTKRIDSTLGGGPAPASLSAGASTTTSVTVSQSQQATKRKAKKGECYQAELRFACCLYIPEPTFAQWLFFHEPPPQLFCENFQNVMQEAPPITCS
jgi:hypothetical protein